MGLGPVPWESCLNPRGPEAEKFNLGSGHLKGAEAPFPIPWGGTAYSRDARVIELLPRFRDEVEFQGHTALPDWITGAFSQGPQGLQDHSEGDRLAPAAVGATTLNPLVLLPVEARAGL